MKDLTHVRLWALVCSVLLFPFLVRSEEDEFAKHLRAGVEEARLGDFSAATVELEAAVALDPNNPEGWYQIGLLRGQIADFLGAETAFRRATQLKSDFAQAHYSLGLTLIANPRNKLDWPGAIAEFREAVKFKADYAEALNLLGAGLTATGETEEAIRSLQRAVELNRNYPEAHFNLAIAFEKSNRLEEAEKEYRATLAARGNYPDAATALGKLLFRERKLAEAEKELTRAATSNPDLTDAHYTLARVLQSAKNNHRAEIEFQIAKDLSERPANAMQSSQMSNQGLELAANNNLSGAAETIRKAIVLKPDYGIPHYNLGLILADTGDLTGAAQELEKAISLLPGQSKPWFQLGRVLDLQGNKQSALQAVSWAVRLSPSDSVMHSELVSLQKANAWSDPSSQSALDSLRVGAAADTPTAHLAFARKLVAQKDFLGAAGEYLRVLALRPAATDARRELARAYEDLGDLSHAVLEHQKILLGLPEDAQSHLALGKIFLAQGNSRAAADEFRITLNFLPDSADARTGLERSLKALPNH